VSRLFHGDSREHNDPVLRWENKLKRGPMTQEEFQPKKDRHGGTGRVALGKLGQQGHRATKIRPLVRCKPEVNSAQIAGLAGPRRSYARNRPPREPPMMDVTRHHGKRRPCIQPTSFFRSSGPGWRGTEVEGHQEARDWQRKCGDRSRLDQPLHRRCCGSGGGSHAYDNVPKRGLAPSVRGVCSLFGIGSKEGFTTSPGSGRQ
jgi:hypothetical protein